MSAKHVIVPPNFNFEQDSVRPSFKKLQRISNSERKRLHAMGLIEAVDEPRRLWRWAKRALTTGAVRYRSSLISNEVSLSVRAGMIADISLVPTHEAQSRA